MWWAVASRPRGFDYLIALSTRIKITPTTRSTKAEMAISMALVDFLFCGFICVLLSLNIRSFRN
nr:MAG TPA: hypothetical protein [Caudoviricetes sp.]